MKTLNLYFDFEFTSLSPDAQPISVGIVSEDMKPCDFPDEYPKNEMISFSDYKSKFFYAEFSDFDINRCDDWVKENVVGKLQYNDAKHPYEKYKYDAKSGNVTFIDTTDEIKEVLKAWLSQFSDYQIQFVCDCGTYDWYWMVQLLAEWENSYKSKYDFDRTGLTKKEIIEIISLHENHGAVYPKHSHRFKGFKTGLPKLPVNISPVPEDLNDLIARVKEISVREAFDLDREELLSDSHFLTIQEGAGIAGIDMPMQKHSAIWDARVIKEIYQKLK